MMAHSATGVNMPGRRGKRDGAIPHKYFMLFTGEIERS